MKKPIDKDVVCLMPWLHMHIWPNGNTFPCCMSDSSEVFGNVYKEDINKLINNEKFKELRRQMLNGEKPKACMRCYELETSADSWTLRKNSLESLEFGTASADIVHSFIKGGLSMEKQKKGKTQKKAGQEGKPKTRKLKPKIIVQEEVEEEQD